MSPGTVAASEPPVDAPLTLFTAVHAPSRYSGADDEAMAWSRSVTGSACPSTTLTSATNMTGVEILVGAKKVKVRDMIAHADLPALSPPFELKATVHGQGAAAAFRLTPSK